jgi:beta-mannosidase
LGAGWDFDDVRDHYLAEIFGVNANKLRYADHDRYLTLSRMATGEVMAAAYSEWRRHASPCNGALVLFLRDLWAGAGWGLVDDAGVPKACYHYLRRTLQPTTVLLSDEGGNGLFAHLINETGEDRQVELEVCAWRAGDVRVASARKVLCLQPHSEQSLPCLEIFGHFMDLNYAYKFGPAQCEVVVATLRDDHGKCMAQAFHFPHGLSDRQEVDVGMRVQVTSPDPLTACLTVSTQRIAIGVHFDIPGFQAGDEFFHLAPGMEKVIILKATRPGPMVGSVSAVNSMCIVQFNLST